MNRVDVRLAKMTGQEKHFEMVVVDDAKELGFIARICRRALRLLRLVD